MSVKIQAQFYSSGAYRPCFARAIILWRNGMCGLKDHDCRARMEARQGREGATRQQNNQIIEHQQDIGIL
jgi:hypothetical protein